MKSNAAVIHLHPRYYRLFTDQGVEMAEKNFVHRELAWRLPLREAALVCLDIWNQCPFNARDTSARTEKIIQARIVPLLAACRAGGLQVIHAPASPVAERQANWVRLTPSAAKSPPAPDWPPEDFRRKTGQFARYARPHEPIEDEQARFRAGRRDFHPAVRPVGKEAVILNGYELQRWCARRGILHLFYVGFWTNACLIMRDYGLLAMLGRGYHAILVRDCTTGMETRDTRRGLVCTRGVIATLEQFAAYTLTARELIRALRMAGLRSERIFKGRSC